MNDLLGIFEKKRIVLDNDKDLLRDTYRKTIYPIDIKLNFLKDSKINGSLVVYDLEYITIQDKLDKINLITLFGKELGLSIVAIKENILDDAYSENCTFNYLKFYLKPN